MGQFVRGLDRGRRRDMDPDVAVAPGHQRGARRFDGGADGRAVALDARALAGQPARHCHPHGPSARSRGGAKSGMMSERRRLSPPRSEEHTSELQSLMRISYAVFCLKKKKIQQPQTLSHTTYTSTHERTQKER